MHYEILVEDKSGKIALEEIVPKILSDNDCTFRIHSYRGIGHLPKGLSTTLDPSKRVLLNQLPRILAGYGKEFSRYPADYSACVIVVCDLDNRDRNTFIEELEAVLVRCDPKPIVKFCLCIEEGEAWLLGHKDAVRTAYPDHKDAVLSSYQYDSICGTWEVLADAVYAGGSSKLSMQGKSEVGRMKSVWAAEIAPLIDISENRSPSFQFFAQSLTDMIEL